MKVAIIGSRTRDSDLDLKKVEGILLKLNNVTEIISGGALLGGDRFAEILAKKYDLPITIFPADWKSFGKSAGMKRNFSIIVESDEIIACWDGISSGTKHSIGLAKSFKKTTYIV